MTANADQAELDKFNALADRWWDPQGEFKPLHQLNPLRVNYIDQRAPLAGRKVLDVGCGGGILSEAMAHRGAEVSGIDLAPAVLEAAKLHSQDAGLTIDYQLCEVEQLAAQQPASFDVVCCLEMLEHVPDPAAVVKACAQLCKPGGELFFSTINRTAKAWLLAVVGAEYVLQMLPRGTHDYNKFIRPAELAEALRQAGLDLRDISGIRYNPISGQFALAPRDVDVNYLLHASKH